MARDLPGVSYDIAAQQFIGLQVLCLKSGFSIGAKIRVEYADGTSDVLDVAEFAVSTGLTQKFSEKAAKADGVITGGFVYTAGALAPNVGSMYAQLFVLASEQFTGSDIRALIGQGYVENMRAPAVGYFEPYLEYAMYVFQGTILDDNTAGTHIMTLTVVPGAGSVFQLVGGRIVVGATATAQTAVSFVDDGTNVLGDLLNANAVSSTTSGLIYDVPSVATTAAVGSTTEEQLTAVPVRIQGTMRLKLQVTTTQIGVTVAFAVWGLLRGGLPTSTLADTVGAPTLTTNTNTVF